MQGKSTTQSTCIARRGQITMVIIILVIAIMITETRVIMILVHDNNTHSTALFRQDAFWNWLVFAKKVFRDAT